MFTLFSEGQCSIIMDMRAAVQRMLQMLAWRATCLVVRRTPPVKDDGGTSRLYYYERRLSCTLAPLIKRDAGIALF